MTVNYIGEQGRGRRGTNRRGVRTYTRSFRLETTDKTEGPYQVGSHSSLPKIGDLYPYDSGAYCEEIDVANTEEWKVWTVTCSYTSEWDLTNAKISWSTEQFQKVAAYEYNGDGIVNSAGDPFDPPAMMDDSRRVVTVLKMMTEVPSWILSYQDAVNSDAFTVDGVSIGIGKAKMQRVSVSEPRQINLTYYREVTMEIHLQRDGWDLQILDAGFRDSSFNTLYNTDGTRPTAPIPLNGLGAKLNSSNPADAVFLPFTVYTALPFSILPLS